MIETGTLLQDRYLIEKQIGAGGMGAVYLAVDQRFDNYVAIKETFYRDEELGEAFEREARLLNALQHPVLPHVSDYFAENNEYFLVMQFIEGEDLSDVLKRVGAFSVSDVLRWTDSLLDALDYLHTQQPPIIHRDIKPHNLKLTTRGEIMLLDFGLAKLNSGDTTGAISIFGYSRTYSPLEQIQGTGTDARSDIFALGATIYHLLTGKTPVDALTRAAAIVNGKPDPLQLAGYLNPLVPDSIANIINSALALNPDQRFVSAKAMRQALEHAASGESNQEISNQEKFEKAPAQTAMAAVPVINSAENENFPALESFAAVTGEKSTPAEEQINAPTMADSSPVLPQENMQENQAQPLNSPYSTIVFDLPTEVSAPRKKQRQMLLAALAAVLILGFASVFFLPGKKKSAVQVNPAPVTESEPAVEPDNISSEPPLTETARENKPKPAVIEKTSEKRTVDESTTQPAVTENSKTSQHNQVEMERSAAISPRAKKEAVGNGEKRARVIIEEPLPASEIETVFTGEKNNRANNREQRLRRQERRIPDDMSQEEFEQLQRERRQKRWKPRKRPIPF